MGYLRLRQIALVAKDLAIVEKQIADVLYTAAHRGDYAQLVIAAPPMIMGDLRKAMHKEVSDKVVAEISKDLTNMPPLEIERNIIGQPGKELN